MSTNYPADFPAERAFDPVEPEVFLWVDPLIIGALLLAALAIGLFGWWLGRNQASHDPDAAESIWKAIDDAAKAAMKADNDALPAKAQALKTVIDKKLGKTLKLAGGLKMKPLNDALAGTGPAHPNSAGGSGNTVHAGPADAAAAATSAGNVTIVSVSGGGATTETPPPPPPPPPPPATGTRTLTAAERNDALRLAVAAINEHWRHKADRIADLRAAHAELSGH